MVSALKRFIADKEAELKGFERLQTYINDASGHNLPKIKASYGRWLFPMEDPLRLQDERGDGDDCYAVAVTAKGAAVICSWFDGFTGTASRNFHVFDSLQEAAAVRGMDYAAVRASAKAGVPIEELDI